MILLAIASLGVTIAVQRAQLDAQREREVELLFVGDQFRQAIRAYAAAGGASMQYPEKLDDLLEDKRLPVPRRYLRRIYIDPMTGKADWQLDLFQGRIVGVRSASNAVPLRRAGFSPEDAAFADAASYAEWAFDAVHPIASPSEPKRK